MVNGIEDHAVHPNNVPQITKHTLSRSLISHCHGFHGMFWGVWGVFLHDRWLLLALLCTHPKPSFRFCIFLALSC